MIIWKKKLIRCCKCGKAYSFDDNLFYHLKEYILICPNCNLMHKVDIKLLGKEYEGLKKVDKLNLTAIDIGSEAENRTAMRNITWTRVDGNNAANASGKITTIEIWAAEALASCKIGIFYRPDPTGNPNKLTTRDYCTIQIAGQSAGVVPAGSKQTATVDLDVVEGDFIGVCGTGQIEGTSATGAWWYVDSALIPYDNTTFYTASPYTISLKGTGATVEAATDNSIMFGMNF